MWTIGLLSLIPLMCASPMQVPLEYKTPHSQPRVPSAKVQHMWAQSLYILCGLLRDKLIAPGEIDPLNRRLGMLPRHDPIVQGD